MSNRASFKGLGVALVTPMHQGKVDYPSLTAVVEHVINGKADFLVVLGTTGEAVTLSQKECRSVLDHVIQVNRGRLPIIAGLFGGNDTRLLLDRIEQFHFQGVDAIMSSSPAYNKPTQEGIFQHYLALAEAAPVPVLIYNVPGRTASNIEAETVLNLAQASDNFLGIKEASGDMVQAMHILRDKPDDFLLLSGDDPTAFPLIAMGGDGLVSVIGNAFPSEFSAMVHHALRGEIAEARNYNDLLLDLHPWLYIDGNPAGIKSLLHELELCSKEVRLPLTTMNKENSRALREELRKVLAQRQ